MRITIWVSMQEFLNNRARYKNAKLIKRREFQYTILISCRKFKKA